MATTQSQVKDTPRATETQDRDNGRVEDAAAEITEHTTAAATTANRRVQNTVVELMRQGQDCSLRAVQVWADMARLLNASALPLPSDRVLVTRSYDLFESLLATQREFIDELIAVHRNFTQQLLDPTPSEHHRDATPKAR